MAPPARDWDDGPLSHPGITSRQPGRAARNAPQLLRYVRDSLTEAGYAPVVTGDTRDLSRLIATHRPDLVLLELLLSGPDGIELMEQVPELADLPVIFISGYGAVTAPTITVDVSPLRSGSGCRTNRRIPRQ